MREYGTLDDMPAQALGTVAEAMAAYDCYGLASVCSGDDTAVYLDAGFDGPVDLLIRRRRFMVAELAAAAGE